MNKLTHSTYRAATHLLLSCAVGGPPRPLGPRRLLHLPRLCVAARAPPRPPLLLTRACTCTALGAKITGVDDQTFSSTGEAYSMIVLPKSNSANERLLQADDVSLGKLHHSPHTLYCTQTPSVRVRSLRLVGQCH